MSTPFYNSEFLMNQAFKNPAVEQAKNDDIELYTINFAPPKFLVLPDKAFLIPRDTITEDVTAAVYPFKISWVV
jgi:hypothetical protein